MIKNKLEVSSIGIPFPNGGLMDDNGEEVGPTVLHKISVVGIEILEGSTPLKRRPFPLDKHVDGMNYPPPHIYTGDYMAPIMTTKENNTSPVS